MILSTAESRTETRPAAFRWRAFGIHLGISLTVLGVLLYILFYEWFPGYLFDTDGGWQALRVIAGVDIILGPVLTLIAANPAKSAGELRKDFTVIGIIQVCALSAGTWLAWDNRPYVIFWQDGVIYSLPWSAVRSEENTVAAIEKLAPQTPHNVVVDLPFDPLARDAAIKRAAADNLTPIMDTRLYRPWPPEQKALQAFTRLSLEMAGDNAAQLQKELDALRATTPETELMPARSRYDIYFIPIHRVTGVTGSAIRVPPSRELLAGLYPRTRLADLLGAAHAQPPQAGAPAVQKVEK